MQYNPGYCDRFTQGNTAMRKVNVLMEKGRVLNGGNETLLRQAQTYITNVLASLQKDRTAKAEETDDTKKKSPKAKAKAGNEETDDTADQKVSEAGGFSVSDATTIIRDALTDLVGDDIAYGEYGYNRVQIEDLFDTAVVYRIGWNGPIYQVDFDIADTGIVTLGTPFEVIRKVSYLPAGTDVASTTPALNPIDDNDEETPASEAATIPVEGDVIPLVERAVNADGTAMLKLIAPGWGSSGYYPADVLRRDGPNVFKAGLHNFIDHPTPTEESQRPEGSIDRVGSVLVENARWLDDYNGAGAGLYARAQVRPGFATDLDTIAPHIGVSIRASGKARTGKVEGREGVIIEAITGAKSVDYVTMAGAGGKVLQLMESARAQREDHTMPASNEVTELRERLAQLENANRQSEGRGTIDRTLATYRESVPAYVLDRASASLAALTLPLTEAGAVDHAKLVEIARAHVRNEIEYLQRSGVGFGLPRDLGASNNGNEDPAPVDTLESALRDLGMSEAGAKIAAVGRG
jgi:hypothetical protein